MSDASNASERSIEAPPRNFRRLMNRLNDSWSSQSKLPIALIVDDPMPCVNPLYYFHLQVRKKPAPPFARAIPVSLLEQFIELIERYGVRGDFSVVPFPAGIGSIAEGLPGFDDAELERWLDLARRHLTAHFDIHPEILTHTLALDLEARKTRDISEHDWMGEQNEETLADYISESMRILKSVNLPNYGVTQPCHFHGDEDAYARAILNAEKRINGRKRSHYFLDVLPGEPSPFPYCRAADKEAGEFVVSIPSGFKDAFWPANDGETDVNAMADYYLQPDGSSGRMKELLVRSCPLIFHTHWQSLYGNGSFAGLHGLAELLGRIEQHLEDFEWMKISQIADLVIEMETTQ